MALAQVTYTVPSTPTQTYAVPFEFLRDSHLTVKVNGMAIPGGDFTIAPSKDEITIVTPTLLAGEKVTVQRVTPVTTSSQLVMFNDASTLRRTDLETMRKQNLFQLQELFDQTISGLKLDLADSKWEAGNRIIKNAADPVVAQDVTTKAWVESAFATGGVLPAPGGNANKILGVNAAGTAYELVPRMAEEYLFRIVPQVSGPVGYAFGWQLPAFASGFANDPLQRAPLELVKAFNAAGGASIASVYGLVLGVGNWIVEAVCTLRGLTDTGATNETFGQMAFTDTAGTTVLSLGPEVQTGYSVGGVTGRMTAVCTVKYFAEVVGSPTTINLRGLGSTSSHSVVADVPSYITVRKVSA